MARFNRRSRRGSLIPLVAVSAISLFAFVALAVDLGMLAVSRTQCQNSADASALIGCRTLNNKTGVVNNNLTQAVAYAKATVTDNVLLSTKFTNSQIQKVEAGQYLYNTTSQTFQVSTWTDVTNNQSTMPTTGSWTGIRVTLSVTQPTYFMRVLGVNSMPMGSTATAVFRPRDVAFALDMTGSMKFASNFNYSGVPMNPDTMVPGFAHYVQTKSNFIATTSQDYNSGQVISMNNYTITTPSGPPIVRNFYFDPVNVANPTTLAYPITSNTSTLINAFHRWNPPESGGDPTHYVGVTYDFTGYNAFHKGTEASPKGPTPAPDTFGSMTDFNGITYVGDRYRRADGSINKSDATWGTGNASTKAAATALELLGYTYSSKLGQVQTNSGGTITTTPSLLNFRDPVWEANGYDLDIVKYRQWVKNTNGGKPGNTTDFSTLVASGDRFAGYSMGPGYWGKTFFIWPPDPRTPVGNPGDASYVAGDWRQRYFSSTSNSTVLSSSAGSAMTISSSATPNYAAILKWIKSGPLVLPPNLRAGRVLYYSSIPDDTNTGSGTTQQVLDKVFWKNYIDYVVGTGGYTSSTNLYGRGDNTSPFSMSINSTALTTWKGPNNDWTSKTPYMSYNDSPYRPRLHLWFGPLSMMDFVANGYVNKNGGYCNWNAGTLNEAQCWQLKAGMNSVISDIQSNHPNDYVGMTMFAYDGSDSYQHPRVPTGQNYNALKNALFYPKSLLSVINTGDVTTEFRPYNSSFSNQASVDVIPNANGGTDPNTGLAIAFNLLSPSSLLPSEYTTTVNSATVQGRRGAAKVVIFETDGVPNCYSKSTLNKRGYNTYYSSFGVGGSGNDGDSTSEQNATNVATQIVKQMATTTASGADSGLSLPNAPARIYPIAFGDLFDTVAAPNASSRPGALLFLANLASIGNTGSATATTIPDNQIITGTYQQRIDRLKNCLQIIFQSGVAVVLIQ